MSLTKWGRALDWRFLLLIILPLSLLALLSVPAISTMKPLSSFASFRSLLIFFHSPPLPPVKSNPSSSPTSMVELNASRIAVCLVGGARRFELTGPSIVRNILEPYPNSDLFLHSPVDGSAYKFSLLKASPRIIAVRLFSPRPLSETREQIRVLAAKDSPNGIQGLLQYFKLVEGCLDMIQSYQEHHNFTYNWIIRTRVDAYWSRPLSPDNFIPNVYTVPPGSAYGGLNDRLGIGDFKTSMTALSRLSLIPALDAAGLRGLNSEAAFKAQLTVRGTRFVSKQAPFCIVTDRRYSFPPSGYGVPVASLSSPGFLSGAKCRPCVAVCVGECAKRVLQGLHKWWSWIDFRGVKICDAHGPWGDGWEKIFDRTVGHELAFARKQCSDMDFRRCVEDLEEMKRRTVEWEAPSMEEICKLGLGSGNGS